MTEIKWTNFLKYNQVETKVIINSWSRPSGATRYNWGTKHEMCAYRQVGMKRGLIIDLWSHQQGALCVTRLRDMNCVPNGGNKGVDNWHVKPPTGGTVCNMLEIDISRDSPQKCLSIPGSRVAIRHAVVYHAQTAHIFSAGTECRHCRRKVA